MNLAAAFLWLACEIRRWGTEFWMVNFCVLEQDTLICNSFSAPLHPNSPNPLRPKIIFIFSTPTSLYLTSSLGLLTKVLALLIVSVSF